MTTGNRHRGNYKFGVDIADRIIATTQGFRRYGSLARKWRISISCDRSIDRLSRMDVNQLFCGRSGLAVEIKNSAIYISGNTATTMGNVMITNKEGKVTTVDKTWQFVKDDNGKLRIVLHHSSLPYAA
ncbi:MAG: hypothetical protein HC778_04940, partial [Chamaesiphon sp. CSU_1_12]|nr:hypothetical protein [Chamaesiphon sp. CSU_1_12]